MVSVRSVAENKESALPVIDYPPASRGQTEIWTAHSISLRRVALCVSISFAGVSTDVVSQSRLHLDYWINHSGSPHWILGRLGIPQ